MMMRAPAFDRLIAALCVALMLFYAATMPVKAANQIQHSPALLVAHNHDSIGTFPVDVVHDGYDERAVHHEDTQEAGGQPDENSARGHHHHGDSGPNLLIPNIVAARGVAPLRTLHRVQAERPIAGRRTLGPDRPPRAARLID